MSSKAWLRLFRAHTAILETPMAVFGAALGLGTLWHPEILKWVIFGALYHYVGYGMNSYVDWKKGFDKDDPRKQHHPLNTGEIQPEIARIVIFGSLILLGLYGLWASNFSEDAAIILVIMYASGIAYNMFGKYITFKFIPISIVHTLVFILPYITYADRFTLPVILITAAYFIHHIFQIGISGEIKDIDQDEANFLRYLGVEQFETENLAEKIEFTSKVQWFASALTVIEIVLVIVALGLLVPPGDIGIIILFAGIFPLGFTAVWLIGESSQLIESGPFDREARVSSMSRRELAGFWMILSAGIPIITIQGWLAIIAASLVYFFPISKFMWGNWLKPEV